MKFFHISDLHLGKRVNEFSMIENQSDILQKIIALAKERAPDAILVAGDVYDKSAPTVEAMGLLDRFLVCLNELNVDVFMISGNHDSPERVSFAADLLRQSGVYIAQSYGGKLEPISLEDDFGNLNIWMTPYLKPSIVREYFPEKEIDSYSSAVAAALGNIDLDETQRNILVAHQFVTGAATSAGSEQVTVGGSENVDGGLFDRFDYVALGHIHRPQTIGRETLRYCGSPLKYSSSEIGSQKSVSLIEIKRKGDITVEELPLVPYREMFEIIGTYDEIMSRDYHSRFDTETDFFHIVLTDEHDEPDALLKLRNIYKRIISFRYDNKRTRSSAVFEAVSDLSEKSPTELFGELFAAQNGLPMSELQKEYASEIFDGIGGEIYA